MSTAKRLLSTHMHNVHMVWSLNLVACTQLLIVKKTMCKTYPETISINTFLKEAWHVFLCFKFFC